MAPVTAEREGRERKIPVRSIFLFFLSHILSRFLFFLSHILSRFLLLSLSYSVQISPLSLIFCPDFSFSLSYSVQISPLSLIFCPDFSPFSVSHFFPLPLPLTSFHNFSFPPLFSPFPPTFLPLSRPFPPIFPLISLFLSSLFPFFSLPCSLSPPFSLSYLVLPHSTRAPYCSIRGQTQTRDSHGLSADTPARSENKRK